LATYGSTVSDATSGDSRDTLARHPKGLLAAEAGPANAAAVSSAAAGAARLKVYLDNIDLSGWFDCPPVL
jgi:hypothetical protein